ncbi:hypothetical protein [Nostoc sp. C052]|nr:hypothetical protein [Nostoc sp. C052]
MLVKNWAIAIRINHFRSLKDAINRRQDKRLIIVLTAIHRIS